MSTAQDQRLSRLVRQHAQTASFFGVDFVPVYRSASGDPDPGSAGSTERAEPSADAMVEPKPAVAAEPHGIEPSSGDSTSGAAPAESQRRLDELRERYERDAPHKKFVTAHTKIVFGEGDPCARLMFIGEAPGADEDLTGRPFVGRAGELLNKMIVAMGLRREDVYIANVLKTRPPGNATPTIEEAALCAPYLFEQIAIVRPEAVVALGLPASRCLLGTEETMAKLRGRWHEFRRVIPGHGEVRVPVMPTYHPAFLLRAPTPENRAKVWSDLKLVMAKLGVVKA